VSEPFAAGARAAFAPRLLLLAAGVGLLAGLAGVGFRLLLAAIQWVAFGSGSDMLVTALAAVPQWRIVMAPALGGLAVGLYFRFVLPGRGPLGPADAAAAAAAANPIGDGVLPLDKSLLGTLANALSLGVGASVGREGPIVLLGGALGAAVARLGPIEKDAARILLAAGVAACVASSFNTPAASVIFALEVVLLRYALVPLPALAVATAIGTVVGRACFGAVPLFPLPPMAFGFGIDLLGAVALGIAGAVVALAMMVGIFAAGDAAARLPVPFWVKTTIAGLAVGIAALWFPHILSYGQEAAHRAMEGRYALSLLLVILGVKLVATIVSLGGGFGGGVFSPALVLGTALGGAFGYAMGALFPGAAAPGAYAALGAIAVAAPVLGAPVSTALIVLEMTEAWNLWPGAAIAAVVATAIARPFAGRSFFTWQLARRGVVVP
jgi:CIC family chloride channel protein